MNIYGYEFKFQWKAHDGSVSCISWANETQYIASGGDDCRFKIWDSEGALLYASPPEDYDITSIQFCPNGLFLAVGGFNMIKLCHSTGVSIYIILHTIKQAHLDPNGKQIVSTIVDL